MDEQKEKEKAFHQLISQVITEADDRFSLDQVKDSYEDSINSPRSLDRAKSLREVFVLLQERGALSWKEVTPLLLLGELLDNKRIKDIVHCYRKLYLDEEDESCEICGSIVWNPPPVPLNEHSENQNCVSNSRNNVSVDSLYVALENVALRIGPDWGVLARELGLIEMLIDKCVEAHPRDYVAQARMAFKLWQRNDRENASIERLDKALDARLCKRKGIGIHLRKTIY